MKVGDNTPIPMNNERLSLVDMKFLTKQLANCSP